MPNTTAKAPLWRALLAIRELQRFRRESADGVPENLETLATEIAAGVVEQQTLTRERVEAALAAAADDDVQRRLDEAMAALDDLRSQIAAAIDQIRGGDAEN